jgi:hypothetical protein
MLANWYAYIDKARCNAPCRPHDIVQGFHGFFYRRGAIEAMDDVPVHIVRAEPARAGVDVVHDVLAGKATVVGPGVGRGFVHHLGGDHGPVPQHGLHDQLAGQLFTRAPGINVGGVEEIDAGLRRATEKRPRIFFAQCPAGARVAGVTETHAARTQLADFQTRLSEIDIFHRVSP